MNTRSLIVKAMSLHREGKLEEAERLYVQLLSNEPENVDAVHLLGVIHHQKKQRNSAEDLYRRATSLQPRYVQAWSNLGKLMQESTRWEDAVKCFRTAVDIEPASGSSWNSLGMALTRTGDLVAAEEAYRNAIHHDPDSAEAYNNLGTILARRGDRKGARNALEEALRKRAGYISPLLNIGRLLREEGLLEDAAEIYRKALALDPQLPAAHWGLAHVLLLRGDLPAGWAEYEWRWALDDRPRIPSRPEPQWKGEPCNAKRIVLYAEQGLGDAVQFVRYGQLLVERGAQVTLVVPQPLVRLFRELPGFDAVCSSDSPSISGDFQCSLLSLPGVFQTDLMSVPEQAPLLHAPVEVQDTWRELCKHDQSILKVGLAWAGSSTHSNDVSRSINPVSLEPLAGIYGVRFYSLQVCDPSRRTGSQLPFPGVVDHSARLSDVAETAGLIAQMDIVITVDTLVAHLAGAMGMPVWILLPFAPDWRWLLGRNDSPWYPAARLFRQRQEGVWGDVVADVSHALKAERDKRESMAQKEDEGNPMLSEGLALHESGRVREAEEQYRAVLVNEPGNGDAQYLLAVSLYQQGRYEEAIALGRKVIQVHPFFPEAYNTLGNSLRKNGDLVGAEDSLRKAIALRPEYADAHYNLGGCLCDAWRLEEAAEEFLTSLRLKPSFTQALNNLGLVRYRQGSIREGIEYLHAAIAQQPEQRDAHWNLAHALLHAGRYKEGWQEFEWRWRIPAFQQLSSRYDRPRWQGEDVRGKKLLVWSEQGFGDTIHFARVMPALCEQGAEIIWECHPAVVPLMKQMQGVTVVERGAPLPEHDIQIPLLSIPSVLGWTSIPQAEQPYLRPDPEAARRWENTLDVAGDRLRVGIVWSGSMTNPEGRFRSIPPDALADLSRIADVFFVNLQKGDDASAFRKSSFATTGGDWSDRLENFAETAALIEQLDLVISVDTAVAHLAGALAKPVWILLAAACDWRWGSAQRTSPWYPSARLYRQQKHGDWHEVLEEVVRDLTLLTSQLRAPWSVRNSPAVRRQLGVFDPGAFAFWNNLGVALLESGNPRDAVAPFNQALALDSDNPRGHLNLAFAQLVDGQWKEGLENHEWRLKTDEGHSSLRPYPQPRWFGQPLRGKSVFLYAEQGFGDAIQCIRYAWLLAQSGARVMVEVRPELRRLMQHAPGVSGVIVRGEEPPPFDYHSPLLSLPFAFHTTPATVPARIPYLIAAHEQLVIWKKRIDAAGSGLRVGVCWSGNTRYVADKERSVTAEMLCSVLPANNLIVVPLVKESARPQRPRNVDASRWCDLTSHIEDFADTAALISYLDLVITVDTAVAHLVGAIGKPVFMLLPYVPDWRWLSGGDTTPWYPTMRLFRQVRHDDWNAPLSMARSAVELCIRNLTERLSQTALQSEDVDG